jgi:hypothetical protein
MIAAVSALPLPTLGKMADLIVCAILWRLTPLPRQLGVDAVAAKYRAHHES